MSYSHFERGFLLALVQAANAEGARGHADAPGTASQFAPTTPEHIARAAWEGFAAHGLLTIGPQYLDGRVTVTITGKGYQLAESIRAQITAELAESATLPRKIGF